MTRVQGPARSRHRLGIPWETLGAMVLPGSLESALSCETVAPLLAAVVAATAQTAVAQTSYPNRSITVIVPFVIAHE